MKRYLIALIALLALVAFPAFAGKGKCTAGTQECLDMMAKNMKGKGLIGLDGEWDEGAGGYKIASFIEGSHAKAAGIHKGDMLVAVNGIALTDHEASYADADNRRPGKTVEITVLRDGQKKSMNVELIAMTEQQIAEAVGRHMLEHAEVQVAAAD